jgi:TolB-like protein/cytochrome c-type biogenesis protein CcmH/NrfG
MFTDIVGYTALTQEDESSTMQMLEDHRRLLRPYFTSHGGREVKTIGDAFLVEFGSALDAVLCAIAIQNMMHDRRVARGGMLSLRIGVHVGDVIESGNDILGDAVNIASRIQPLAQPGGVCISGPVYEQVKNKLQYSLDKIATPHLKNVREPVDVYKILMPWSVETPASSVQLDKKRIAILPFTNMSSNPEEGYFADGMTEELITSLSGVRQLTVIARTSVMKYKGSQKGASDVGKELNVGTLIEGSVRKAGNRVRITAQLIDTSTEGHLWAQNYDRQLEDVFAIQSEIAEKVAGELRIRLVDSERSVIEKKATENTEAYTSFLRGRELLREGTIDSAQQAIGFYEKAIELDPKFARAYVGVAECHGLLSNVGKEQFDVAHSSARQLLERALNLDPNLPEAHACLSEMLFDEDDALGSEAEARRALELNPSLPEPYWMLFELAGLKGDTGEMVRWIQTAYRLDPIRPLFIWLLGLAYLYTGREREAMEHWMKNEQLAPLFTYRGMIEYYLSKGDLKKAEEFNAKAEKLDSTNPRVIWMGGVIAAMEGDRERALLAIRKIEEAELGPAGLSYVGLVYHALGDLDSYFQYMNKALEAHAILSLFVMYSPLLAKARADPRYLELMERIRKQTGLTK